MAPLYRRLLLVIAGLIVFGLLLVAAAHLPVVRARVMSWAAARLAASAGLEVTADRLDYNLLTLSATARGVTVAALDRKDAPLFQADAVHATLPRSVLGGVLAFRTLELERPRIHIVRDAKGNFNLPVTGSGSRGRFGKLRIDRLLLRDLTFDYDDLARDVSIGMDALSLDMEPDGQGAIAGVLARTARLTVRLGTSRTTMALGGGVRFDGESVDLNELSATGPEGVLRLNGRIASVLGEPTLDLRYSAEVDVTRAVAWTPVAQTPSGRLIATGAIEGPAGNLRVTGDMSGSSLVWAGITNIDAQANVELSADALTVSRVSVKLPSGELGGSLRVPFVETGPIQARASWKQLDAAQLAPLLPANLPSPAATMTGAMEFEWTGSDRRAVRIEMTNRSEPLAAEPGEIPLGGDVTLLVENGRWRATHDHQLPGAADISGVASGTVGQSWDGSTLNGDLQFTSPDLAALGRIVARAGLVPVTAVDGLSGDADLTARLSGTVGAPALQGTFTGRDVAVSGFGPVALEGGLALEGQRLRLQGVEARRGANLMTFDGSYAIGSGALQGTVTGRFEELDAITATLPEPWRPTGALDFAIDLGGTATRPLATGTFTGRSLVVAAQPVASVTGSIRVEQGMVSIDNLALAQPGAGRLNGRVGYNATTGAFVAKLDGQNLAITSLPPGAVSEAALDLTATADIQIDAHGTREQPLGSAHFKFSALDVGSSRLGPSILEATFRDGAAWIEGAATELALAIDGRVALVTPFDAQLNVQLTGASLERLAALYPNPTLMVTGTTNLSATASGPLAAWREMNIDVRVATLEAQIDERPIVLVRPATLRYGNDEISVEDVELGAGNARVSLGGRLSRLGDAGQIGVKVVGPIEELMPFARLAGAPPDIMAHGSLNMTLEVRGVLSRPTVSATVSLDEGDLIWTTFSVSGLMVRGELADGVLRLDPIKGYWQGASVDATGELPLSLLNQWLPEAVVAGLPPASGVATVRAKVDPLTAAALSPWLPPETASNLDGRMTLTIALETDRLELAGVMGTITIDDAMLSFANVPLAQEVPTRITVAEGRVHVDATRWSGTGTVLVASGEVDLASETREVDVRAEGSVDLRLLTAFMTDTAAGGLAELDMRVQGPVTSPVLEGRINLRDVDMGLRNPRLALSQLNGPITFANSRIAVEGLKGLANGGAIEIQGALTHRGFTLDGGELTMTARGVAIEYPEGLRSLVNGDLVLTAAGQGDPVVTGEITIERGAYRRNLSLTRELLAARSSTVVDPGLAPSRFGSIRLDIALRTDEDLVFDNNYGRLELGGDLRLTGTLDRPALGGRAMIREGGEIYLSGNTYLIDRGNIDFLHPSLIEPTLDVTARTRVAGYDITMNITGAPGAIKTDLTSDPPLGQDDVMSLLLTGRTLEQARGEQGSVVAQEQVLGLLSGELLNAAGQAVGLDRLRLERGFVDDSLRVDPGFIATEEDPAARLTIAKNLRPDVEAVLSRNLREDGLTWILSYKPRRLFELRAVSKDNNDRSYEFSQDLTFGGPPRPKRTGRPEELLRIADVRIAGDSSETTAELTSKLRLEVGDRFDFYRWQDDQDRLLGFFHDRGHYEARVTSRRTTDPARAGEVILDYTVVPGPATRLVVEGATLPGSVLDEMRDAWRRSVLDDFLLDDLRVLARRSLIREGYMQASVDARVESNAQEKTVTVAITPGPTSARREIVFTGNTAIGSGEILDFVQARSLDVDAWIDPAPLAQAVAELYRSRGWLAAEAHVGEPVFEGQSAVLPVTITEGPAFKIADVRFTGVAPEREEAVRTAFTLQPSDLFDPARVEAGLRTVGELYQSQGFGRAVTSIASQVDRDAGTVVLEMNVKEGSRQILDSVSIVGAEHTNHNFLTQALNLQVGTPVDRNEWYAARRRLYDTGVFRRVDIEPVPIETADSLGGGAVAEVRVEARVTVEEVATTRFRYGLEVTDERAPASDSRELGPGLTASLERFNVFGRAAKTGVAFRYDRSNRIGRVYLVTPRFFGKPITSSLFVSRSRERFGEEDFLAFLTDRWTFTAEQRFRPMRRMEMAYSYQFESNRTFDPNADPDDPFRLDILVHVARLNSTTTIDRRDDPFDATTGWFHSSSYEYAPEFLGSDLRFMKYLAQLDRLSPDRFPAGLRLGAPRWPRRCVRAGADSQRKVLCRRRQQRPGIS